MAHQYNAPPGTPSTVGPTHVTMFHIKKSLVTARQQQFFTQLADVTNMPKHYGKTIKVYEYIPLLDDRNVNTQGIDASGVALTGAAGANPGYGNLYGSSKDIGVITGKIPVLSEVGGRVNRVGFTRIERQAVLQKCGFFTEWTQDSVDFDDDEELLQHFTTELMKGAVEISEDLLQKDLLLGAGVLHYAGTATSRAAVTAEGAGAAIVDWGDLQRVATILDENRTPKHTKVITGSRMIDTKTIPASRVMYAGAEVLPILENMVDSHSDPAWIPVQKYADAANVLVGEEGSVGKFRVINVPEMMHWSDGATVGTNPGYRVTGTKYNVYPLLVVGSESFTTIGFQTDGKTVKFAIKTKMPGETADRTDPYGETGFQSIKWFYATLITRPERIAVIHTVAPI